MGTFLLDTNIVSYFLEAGREKELATAAARVAMKISDRVGEELERAPRNGGQPFKRWLAGSNIGILAMLAGSEASITFAQLPVPTKAIRGLGERASIALAASDPSLILVTHDKNATWLALREIWRSEARLMGVAPFLRMLFAESALTDPALADEVIALSEQRPTWWASWRAGLTSTAPVPATVPPAAAGP